MKNKINNYSRRENFILPIDRSTPRQFFQSLEVFSSSFHNNQDEIKKNNFST